MGGIASYIRDFTYNVKNIYNYRTLFITISIIKSMSIKALCFKIYSILFNILKIISFSIKHSYDITHIHTSSKFSFIENSVYIFFLKAFSRRPVVLHIHAPDFDSFLSNSNCIRFALIKHTLNSCDSIIVLSSYWKEIISEVTSEHKSIFIVPNAADVSSLEETKMASRKRLNLPENTKILFSVGNLEERKGYSYLIEAMSIVCNEREDVCCIIGGNGSVKPSLELKVSDLNLDNHIKFIGFIPDEMIKFWFNACDIFVLPSLAEGSPIVMFETLNFGKPFVGTTVGGIPEIITSEDYGLLVKPRDSKDLSQKILYALDKEWDRELIISYSRQFNWANICKRVIEDVYLKLV
ncbi:MULTISPECIES: glycosyltransferase family 4 protein [unclassified Methanosarcina]|uniref:glycosyltransferase family 4 protein n=1 Tax=unclassified Methanosarcina TaxID=2644672 RepID=UPI00138DEE94|nr:MULTISPECIES: glycosyltransferase family 4 protein [unclassified Methanosarcina]